MGSRSRRLLNQFHPFQRRALDGLERRALQALALCFVDSEVLISICRFTHPAHGSADTTANSHSV